MIVRGHHLVCVYCFAGSGKATAAEFFGNDNAIPQLLEKLRAEPEVELTVAADFDDICGVCSNRTPAGCGRGTNVAAQTAKLRQWDRAILERLGLSHGDRITARDLEERIRRRIPDIGEICANCTSSSPSGWREFRIAIRTGLWPQPPAGQERRRSTKGKKSLPPHPSGT